VRSGAERKLAALRLAAVDDLHGEVVPLRRRLLVAAVRRTGLPVERLVDQTGVLVTEVVELLARARSRVLDLRG